MTKFTIELDCEPGWPRPGDLIEGVIEELGLELKEPVSKCFGNWMWEFESTRYEEIKPILKKRITALHDSGHIRYGSW